MATTSKALFRGAATTNTATTLYTVPASTVTVVTNIVLTNTSTSVATYTLSLNGISIATNVPIAASDSYVIDMKQVINAGNLITGGASVTSINFHISGVEIS